MKNSKTLHSVTKAYLTLLFAFGVVLVIGSVKGTFYPDEKVYMPGKVVALYDAEKKVFVHMKQSKRYPLEPAYSLTTDMFGYTPPNNHKCE